MSHSSSTSSVISSDSDNSSSTSPYKSCDTYVIRVSLEPSDQADTHIYKSIMVRRTPRIFIGYKTSLPCNN